MNYNLRVPNPRLNAFKYEFKRNILNFTLNAELRQIAQNLLLYITLLSAVFVHAQNLINSAGEDIRGASGTCVFALGQVGQLSFSQVPSSKRLNISFLAYPNPTKGYLNLELEELYSSNLTYRLFNNNGVLLQAKQLTKNKTQIDLSYYTSSSYLLQILSKGKPLKQIKILKI